MVPPENAHEASLIEGLAIRTAPNLRALVQHLKGDQPWSGIGCRRSRTSAANTGPDPWPCLDSSLQLLRVARTIADLNDRTSIDRNAVAEASCFRCTDLLKQPGSQ